MKHFKKNGSRFNALGPHLRDVYLRLYWQNSGLVRKYERKIKPKKKYEVPPLKSNSLEDQLNHHLEFRESDDELIDYFINGGEVDNDTEWNPNRILIWSNQFL